MMKSSSSLWMGLIVGSESRGRSRVPNGSRISSMVPDLPMNLGLRSTSRNWCGFGVLNVLGKETCRTFELRTGSRARFQPEKRLLRTQSTKTLFAPSRTHRTRPRSEGSSDVLVLAMRPSMGVSRTLVSLQRRSVMDTRNTSVFSKQSASSHSTKLKMDTHFLMFSFKTIEHVM